MVKGTARRVIVIKSPDPRLFEEAIFIVKEDAAGSGVTGGEILRQAQEAADAYIREHRPGRRRMTSLPPAFFALAGAAVTAVLWIVSAIL